MNFEDELLATMRAHDGDAPTTADLPAGFWRRGRSRVWLPAVAAAAVVAALAVTIALLTGSSPRRPASAPASPVSCPAKYQAKHQTTITTPWVPAKPRGVPEAAARLVPDKTPTGAVVCAYLHGDDGRLTGRRTLAGNLGRIPVQLASLPKRLDDQPFVCPLYLATTDGDNYLLGLRYPTGLLWVSAPGNHCSFASNGRFLAATNLRADADTAYRTGSWPGPVTSAQSPCTAPEIGRLGDDRMFVPGRPVRLTICGNRGKVLASTEQLAALVATLNGLSTTHLPGDVPCVSANGPHLASTYVLYFHYATGPDAIVGVWKGCYPAIQNRVLISAEATKVLAEIGKLVARH